MLGLMFNIVLFEPEIPQNTGNIMRLCANAACNLHLIKPMGFVLDDKKVRRAGLDYINRASWFEYDDFAQFMSKNNITSSSKNIYLCTTKASTIYSDTEFQSGDYLVFGPESRGLPSDILDSYPQEQKIKIPMAPEGRSLNLATAVGIIMFEAWRQNDFSV